MHSKAGLCWACHTCSRTALAVRRTANFECSFGVTVTSLTYQNETHPPQIYLGYAGKYRKPCRSAASCQICCPMKSDHSLFNKIAFSDSQTLITASACLQLGIVPFAGVDIAAFEIFKEHLLHRYEGDPPPLAILGAGMMSSSIAQFASYPLALVRTRLQVRYRHLPWFLNQLQ